MSGCWKYIKINYMKKEKIHKPKIDGEKEFYTAINNAMKTSNHKDALKDIIDEYEKYKKFMEKNTISITVPQDKIYTFKLTYQLKKQVWRELEIFGDQTLEELAELVIDSMDWDNDHLHAFWFPEIKGKSILSYWYTLYSIGSEGYSNDQFPELYDFDVPIASIDYSKNPKLGFAFDFGDDHRFLMEYKSVRPADKKDTRDNFPKLIDQRGVGPEQYPEFE